MKDVSLNNIGPPAASALPTSPARRWQLGQILQIRAETNTDEIGRLLLRIGRQTLTAQAPIEITAGTRFSAQVQSLEQRLLLKILSLERSPPAPLNQYLRQIMPKSSELTPLLQTLVALDRRVNSTLPPPISKQLTMILNKLPTLQQLREPAGLQTALKDSGLFLEAELQQAVAIGRPYVEDFKARLLQFRQILRKGLETTSPRVTQQPGQTTTKGAPEKIPLRQLVQLYEQEGTRVLGHLAQALTNQLSARELVQLIKVLTTTELPPTEKHPAFLAELLPTLRHLGKNGRQVLLFEINKLHQLHELLKHTESALHRLQANQLATVARDSGNNDFLLLELPLYHDDEITPLQLQIQRQSTQDDEEEQWSVTLDFRLPGLGALRVNTHLRKQQLTAQFQAARQETTQLIREHLPQLHGALDRLGLSIADLSAVQAEIQAPPLIPAGHHLVDEQA